MVLKINEGNIFEAMRLVLPEHRGVIKRWQSERSVRNPPIVSEDEVQEMQYIISEAVENGSRLRLTLFGAHGDTMLEGTPVYDGRLKMTTDYGTQEVDLRRLIKVELM